MHLVDGIRKARAQEKTKKPLPRSVWVVVAAIVKQFGLVGILPEGPLKTEPLGRRAAEPLSLFPLVTAAQMHLCNEIMDKFNNPYLVYARSPEDFRTSQLLHARRPDLSPEVFRQYSPSQLLRLEGMEMLENYPPGKLKIGRQEQVS
jgi:hypothetical protein